MADPNGQMEEQSKILDITIFYNSAVEPNKFIGSKERKRVSLKLSDPLNVIIKNITKQAGLMIEADKRGLTSTIDVKLSLVDRSGETKVYAISTEDSWIIERNDLDKPSSHLQGLNRCYIYFVTSMINFRGV